MPQIFNVIANENASNKRYELECRIMRYDLGDRDYPSDQAVVDFG